MRPLRFVWCMVRGHDPFPWTPRDVGANLRRRCWRCGHLLPPTGDKRHDARR